MDSSVFKIFIAIVVSIAIFYVVINIKEGIENRNETYLRELGVWYEYCI